MSFTGVLDVDINIISFCDLETIENLVSINKFLISKAVSEIVKNNLDNSIELAGFIIDLIDINEIEIVKKFIEIVNKFGENKYYYQTLLSTYLRQDVLEIYFDCNCNYNKIIKWYRDYLDFQFQLCLDYGDYTMIIKDVRGILNDILIFNQAAINSENIIILQFIINYYDNDIKYVYNDVKEHEDFSDVKDYFDEIDLLNSEAKEIIENI